MEESRRDDQQDNGQPMANVNRHTDFPEDGQMVREIDVSALPKKMRFFKRLGSLFFAPVRLMENIKDFPVLLAPLLVLALLALPCAYFNTKLSAIMMEQMALISIERYGVDYFSQSQQVMAAGGMTAITTIISFFTLVITFFATAAVSALVVLVLTKIFRGKTKFVQYFSMYLHISIITTIGAILYYALATTMDTTLNFFSLAAVLMPNGNIANPVYNLLSAVELFTLWGLVLAFFGIRVFNKFSAGKAAVIVAIQYALTLAVSTIMTSSTFLILDMTMNALQQ